MTQAFSDMLYLFSCAAHGVQPEKKTDMDLDEIYHKAASQGILPLVLTSLKELYMNDGVIICGTPLEEHIKRLRMQALNNIQRGYIIRNAIKQLADNGISCCVLKGDTVAVLYHNPDCRISNDTDVYIDTDEKDTIKKAKGIFEENGFKFGEDQPDSHHFNGYHMIAGHLELHHSLFRELYSDVWFDNKTTLADPFQIVKTPIGIMIPALGVSDGLKYTYLHMVKHFLRGGIGIRPLMDVLLYIKHYKDVIDIDSFYRLTRHLKYDNFLNCITYIGIKYLGFKNGDLLPYKCDDAIAERVLTDIEAGGLFGQNEAWRFNFHMVYNEQRFYRFKSEDYTEYMKTMTTESPESPAKRFFKKRYRLMKEYKYVAKHKFLLPIAWIHRAFKFLRVLLPWNRNRVVHSKKAKKRMDLIHELEMI